MTYEQSFITSLAITLLVEIPIVFLLVKYVYKKIDKKGIIFASIVASALTLPYLWFILPFYLSDRMMYLIFGELIVLTVEALVYLRVLGLSFKQAMAVSFFANLISTVVGLIINF